MAFVLPTSGSTILERPFIAAVIGSVALTGAALAARWQPRRAAFFAGAVAIYAAVVTLLSALLILMTTSGGGRG